MRRGGAQQPAPDRGAKRRQYNRRSMPARLFTGSGAAPLLFLGLPSTGLAGYESPGGASAPSCGARGSGEWRRLMLERRAVTPQCVPTWQRRTPSPTVELMAPLSASFSYDWRVPLADSPRRPNGIDSPRQPNGSSRTPSPPGADLPTPSPQPISTQPEPAAAVSAEGPASAVPSDSASPQPCDGDAASVRPPCSHNNWDNVRTKKGRFALRCRECGAAWRVPCAQVTKCPQFFYGFCPLGRECPHPHIHKYKNREREAQEAKRQAAASIAARRAALDVAAGAANADELAAIFAVPAAVFAAPPSISCSPQPSDASPSPPPRRAAQPGTQGAAPAAANAEHEPPPPRPCEHNNWDAVKLAKGRITLRCRSCGSFWKAAAKSINKCPDFFAGYCPSGISCGMPHVHRYKNPRKEAEKARLAAMACMQAASVAGGSADALSAAVADGSSFAADPSAFVGVAKPGGQPDTPSASDSERASPSDSPAAPSPPPSAAAAGVWKQPPAAASPPAGKAGARGSSGSSGRSSDQKRAPPVKARTALPKAKPLPMALPVLPFGFPAQGSWGCWTGMQGAPTGASGPVGGASPPQSASCNRRSQQRRPRNVQPSAGALGTLPVGPPGQQVLTAAP
eukprot:TRINITY_DN25_c0_g2_i1.p1 TRINITY_DN25_c0_g2~~TRINITY_DN25_c0_g2_i1.p1  ORF type:complete len:625 (+),score=143.18 TRINITY_DN25_c0_g2_i1:319-2193(+)